MNRYLASNIEGKIGQPTVIRTSSFINYSENCWFPLQILPTISLTLIFLLALQTTILLHYYRFLGYIPYHSEVHLLIGMNIYDTMLDLSKRYHNSQVPRVEQELLILSEHLSSPLILSGVLCCSIFSFMCNAL